MIDFVKTAATLAKQQGVEKTTVKVDSLTYSEKTDYTVIIFNLVDGCKGMVRDTATDEYVVGTTTTISTTLNMWRMLLRTTDLNAVRKIVCSTEDMLQLVLEDADLEVLSVEVKANVPHKNPFNDRADAKAKVYDHDTIIHYIVGVKLSDTGKDELRELRRSIREDAIRARRH